MEQTTSSETDPPEIRKRLECIQGQRALIEDLATRLKAAQLEYDRLEKELDAYRTSIAPIRKCPVEVLLMIFEAFSEDAPELLASLLQVCKRWHDVAINAPHLWTHIRIKVKPTWNQEEGARRDQARIKTCLKRSASLPLHINVDLTNMLDEDSRMSGFINELLGGCDNDICSWARRQVWRLEDNVDAQLRWLCGEYGPENVLQTISELVGSNGRHMGRWKTLQISLPRYYHEKEIPAIWELFCHPTPRLTKLVISGGRLSQRCLSPRKPGSFSFLDLSSLEDLTLWGKVTELDFLPLTFTSLKRLDITTSISNTLQLSRFTNLEYLDILFNKRSVNANSALEVIHLPLLRDLTLHIYGNGSTKVEWHVPVLQRLEIFGWIDDELKTLPTVRASHVCWTIGESNCTTEIESSLLSTLKAIVSKYGDMQKLSMGTSRKHIWDKYVQGLDEEKRLALPAVDFSLSFLVTAIRDDSLQ